MGLHLSRLEVQLLQRRKTGLLAGGESIAMKGHMGQEGEWPLLSVVSVKSLGMSCSASRLLFSFSVKKRWQLWLNREAGGLVPF